MSYDSFYPTFRGKQIVIDSSHEIPTEHPEVVISAIHEVWLAARVYCSGAHHGLPGSNPLAW
jgi:hypothetical protein